MFKTVISSTQLTSDAANNFFQNITGNGFRSDYSFLTTLRALVAPRMKETDRINLSFTNTDYTASTIGGNDAQRTCRDITSYLDYQDFDGMFVVHNLTGNQTDNYANLELFKSSLEKARPGWHMLEKATQFFKKVFYVLCFINPDKKSVVIFTDNMDIRKMHYLQCGIFAFLPWYFSPEEGVSEIEMALINSLRETNSTKYEDCIAKIAEKYDFKKATIKKLLSGFETRYERQECDKVRQEIENIIYNINDLNDRIGSYLRDKNEKEIKLLGLETKIANGDSDDSEIMEYFLCNDNLVLETVTQTVMTFSCKGYLEYFDEDMARRMIENNRSYVYLPRGRACNNYIPADDMKLLMTAIFLDQSIRMKFCSSYTFNLNGNVSANSAHHYGSEFRECTPNTHIDRHSCMGNYSRTINTLLKERNYIGAIEQCVASCKSLNFGDSIVMGEFMSRLYGLTDDNPVNIRCIELPDGRVVEPKEAIEYLKSEGTENE